MTEQNSVRNLSIIASAIIGVAVLIIIGMVIIGNIGNAGSPVTTPVDNETLDVDYDAPTLFSNNGDGVTCSLGDVFWCSEGCTALGSEYYIDQSPLCSIQATEYYNVTTEDCEQQMVNQSSEGDDSCDQKYTGVYDCSPPASNICEQDDAGNWTDLDWDTYFNMTANPSNMWGYVSSSWIYPDQDYRNDAEFRVKFQNDSAGSPVTESYQLAGTGCLESGTTGTTIAIIADNDSTYRIQCSNDGDWATLTNGTYDEFYLFEQEIYWNLSEETSNPFAGSEYWDVNYEYSNTPLNPTANVLNGYLAGLADWIPALIAVAIGVLLLAYFTGRKQY